jgi:hypothetical protein
MRSIGLTLALLATAGVPVRAQDGCLQQVKFPEVGSWAEYQALYNANDRYTVRYAVVGAEEREGKDLKWLEMQMRGGKKDGDMVYQMLVPGSPAEMGQVQEIVFKTSGKPAMKMSGGMMKMVRDQIDKQAFLDDICENVSLVGKERVTVPAGEFQAHHYRSAKYGTDTWIASGVPFSLVKSVGENHQVELAAQGAGAKSSITEKPQEMPELDSP